MSTKPSQQQQLRTTSVAESKSADIPSASATASEAQALLASLMGSTQTLSLNGSKSKAKTTSTSASSALLAAQSTAAQLAAALASQKAKKEKKDSTAPKEHKFWSTQPVPQAPPQSASTDSSNAPNGAVASIEDTDYSIEAAIARSGPIEQKTIADVPVEPYPLPAGFEWVSLSICDASEANEVYSLLNANYVEDDDNMFRFDYSLPFLQWALRPPGYRPEWHIGVRAKPTAAAIASAEAAHAAALTSSTDTKPAAAKGKLVAFISGVPADMRVYNHTQAMVEINFLCVHKKLRAKRLAPVLIKEVTRRVNLCNIWQAVYTAGVVLPLPVAQNRYWHRSLHPKKLIEIGFSRLAHNMTMLRTIKHYKLPTWPVTAGFRKMRPSDVPQVTKLLNTYLSRFSLAPVMSESDVEHWLLPRAGVVSSFVVEQVSSSAAALAAATANANAAAAAALAATSSTGANGKQLTKRQQAAAKAAAASAAAAAASQASSTSTASTDSASSSSDLILTDFCSYYSLPSTIIGHARHSSLSAAYSFYNVSTVTPLVDLMNDCLSCAVSEGFDVFNALDLMDNSIFFKQCKFGIGDGNLHYYLYNWKCPKMSSNKVGLVLL